MPQTPKLRCQPPTLPFKIVLVEPEIPPNTGAIARTCAATHSELHLVGKLGFDISDRAVKRAGIDYWHLVSVHQHASLAALRAHSHEGRFHYFSSDATRSYTEANFAVGDHLVFGCESVGLPKTLLDAESQNVYGIPTSGGVRSLNLSNAVAIVLFEALRTDGCLTDTFVETDSSKSP